MTPYIVPAMLTNLAPFGIDWASIPITGALEVANTAALYDICLTATGNIDNACFMPLRAIAEVETLDGPNFRLTIRQSTGVAVAQMQHWPILEALGAQVSPAGAFPRVWSQIPSNMMEVGEPSQQFVGGAAMPSGGGDGMNEIIIAPGYMDWINGRWGYTVQIAYVNGWPHAGIDETANAGATSIHVDDVTGFAGTRVPIWDAASSETVYVTEAVADSPVTLMSGLTAQIGPGTLTLSTGLQYQHQGITSGSPVATAVISGLPDVVRTAGYYFAAAESMARGTTQISVPALPGSLTSGGQPSAASLIKVAQTMLVPLHRVI